MRPSRYAAALLLAGLLVGCQSSQPMSGQELGKSVVTDKATFVDVPTGQGTRQVVAYTRNNQAVCPECRAVADDYFKTGVLSESVCKSCGSTISVGQGRILNQ